MWSLNEAIEFINSLQEFLLPLGFATGLTGGILKTGKSEKDIDVVIYPLKKSSADISQLMEKLPSFGLKYIRLPNRNQGYNDDGKDVRVFDYSGKRVDLFFLN